MAINPLVESTLPKVGSTNAGVNLIHLELFHHFLTHTVSTLALTPDVWRSCIPLSFHFDFLANIILSLAARHIAFLGSKNNDYKIAAARHLGLCLASFHAALQRDLDDIQIDAFIATSLLLLHVVWTEFEVCRTRPDGVQVYCPAKDGIFTFATSLKGMFLHVLPRWPGNLEKSAFLSHLRRDPCLSLERALKASGSDNRISLHSHDEGLAKAAHLINILDSCVSVQTTQQGMTLEAVLFSDLTRSILSFPILCRGAFASMVQNGDPQALTMLCQFYQAVRILLPYEQGWWAQERARVSIEGLLEYIP